MSLNDFVVDALVRAGRFKGDPIWTVENQEKYSTLNKRENRNDLVCNSINHQIFQLMRTLNQQGLEEDGLCADPQGQGSLKVLIGELAGGLAALSRNARVHYVELGPEPIKTAHILEQVKAVADSIRYTAIDINEASKSAMSDAVTPIVADCGSFNYIAADYHTVTHNALAHDQDITLITMLGFQEGNELPVTTGRLIRNLAGDATYIVSEMQIYEEGMESSIRAFYANPNMVRFSELVACQQGFIAEGDHETTIVRLKILDELIHVAVTLQPVSQRERTGHLLTNICLKYTPEQFRRVRAMHGNCNVVNEFTSGDGSVRYQIAKYLQ